MMLAVLENQKHTSQLFEKPLQVAVFGFDPRTRQTLEIAFKNIGNNCATIVTNERAQAVIFNFDNLDSRALFLNFRKEHFGFPTIVISSREIALRGAYVVTKPLRVRKFMEVFQQIQKSLSAGSDDEHSTQFLDTDTIVTLHREAEPHQPDSEGQTPVAMSPGKSISQEKSAAQKAGNRMNNSTDIHADKQTSTNIYYSRKKYLQSSIDTALQEATEKYIVIELAVKVDSEWLSFTFFPGIRKVAIELNEQQLKYICSAPLYCTETKIFRQSESQSRLLEDKRKGDDQLVSFESFLWLVALWTSEGRIPKSIELNKPYRLRRWPNFTRLASVPDSLPLAALLTQKPITLNLLLKIASIPPQHVFSFFSCVYALGLLDAVNEDVSNSDLHLQVDTQHPKRNLFVRLIDKLTSKR
jgi:hypothetical protein